MTTSIHVTALDGIINVNSLFTLAVFLGLTWNPRDGTESLAAGTACAATPRIAEDLVAFHVYSFSCFLFSSLVALALKQAIRFSIPANFNIHVNVRGMEFLDQININKGLLRAGMLVSGAGSASGCLFLMLALINVVQIKVGTLACGSVHALAAIVPLVILVPVALLVYVCVILYAFTR